MSASSDSRPPIAGYALLGDCHSAALVGRDGSIDWWCAPRFDSRSAFARLLDRGAGHWSIRPADPYEVERRYLPGTLVLETTFRTAGGVVRVTDALALAPGVRGHDLGARSPHAIVRRVDAIEGAVTVSVEYAPRLEYGLVTPVLASDAGSVRTVGGPDTLVLASDAELAVDGATASAQIGLAAGESTAFSLQHHAGMRAGAAAPPDARAALADAELAWRSWSELHEGYTGAYRDQVLDSARVLQALTFQPSGAVVAAATTSLPEIVGGGWNWDYRFAWLRDASLTLEALWVAACPDEAGRYFTWMAEAAVGARSRGHVQIMFGVEGERDLTEHELDHLEGYRASRPVRVGNDAWRQTQLDVYGEVLDAAWVLREQIGELSGSTAEFLCALADLAAERWGEPDAGIWEGREGERHYLSSKLMCWVALDRAVRLASMLRAGDDRTGRWSRERDRVRADILAQGWSEAAGAYTGAYGSDHLDASVLLMPRVGFLPATDERMRQTIDVIERELADGPFVRRWTGAEEGGFVICSFWLANCLARAGEPARAREIVDGVLASASDLGLMAEQVDPGTGELMGNFPQAFSHVGLINAAWTIDHVERTGEPPHGRGPTG